MLLILSAVAEDHSKLCILTSILMKSKEAVSLASDIIMEYGKSFPSAVTIMPSCQQASTSTSSSNETHLEEFCEDKLTMFSNRQLKRLSSSLLTCETIKFVLKWNPSKHSLSNIKALLSKTFKDNQVEVVVIKEGNSIIVTCYAPHYLMESLLVTARDNIDMLKEMGLISLTIGYYTVYDELAIDEEMKSLMVESERDNLLEENAKLKVTIDTLGISYEGREVDESNKSSMQSSEFEKKDSKKKMTKAMQMEIDRLQSSLQSKTGHPEPPGWACPSCTFKNLPLRPGCEVCGSTRPDDYQPPPNYVPTDAEKKFINNNDLQELNNFLENERLMQRQQAEKNYKDYLNTDAVPVVLNEEEFECPVCFTDIDPGEGIRLRDCLHMVCMDCLKGTILHSQEAQVKCPYMDDDGGCEEYISDREIREVLNDEELESFFKRGLRIAEATDPNSFHCKTADCPGFCFYEGKVNEFKCQNCDKLNCILCKAQHEGMNCQEYQDDLKIKAANNEAEKETQAMLEKMIADGKAMRCPNCKIIIIKKIGSDWIRCVLCKTEMCWATKGPRWGSKGRGDISGGCRCGVNNTRCHPNCRNCF
ncbi:PREDICTED: ranBP-type and C3HC4-type zinc finger-containing protein 1-like [Amphimedon queenslandica]|uniref:RanBP-type and C3HC4-type zinc finger-containing protein 1 n=1 Tax=Amphimedon queenslandica TaxID=400682 RepID=A0AAN0J216_AMPQE|nr:PREDICTED: ranBP-type and C3HC4-type zinc finger-containing protein 1-like [Amphimedon queenslandica]|eukprot:XP_019850766.1 PREDICTED: ranBP-type and C3HC4-type zinc finger-containing protein 1-like [Amphimedon queenslandica]